MSGGLFGDRCYRPDEVAKRLDVSVRSIYRWMRDLDDPLPAYRMQQSGPLRIPGNGLNAWLDRRRVDPFDE